ncbi:putative coiled-coil protein (DUF2205) domain-containing protein [Ditylenchus destructor]|uniref:Coiled-coil protein (DUF2205) domain-containing protein n=1 Tax=Ditylenchus destructor TaxID=166010 RepID=A0AAD4NA96_9BILA|nr:putative coiled-coil protein (DUF2205) domain-containing protein [Ditylenchus destructor]
MADEEVAKTSDFPLADDETFPNELDKSSRHPKPAQPLPKDEFEDLEERARLISQILELQNTLEDLSHRYDSVKDECSKLCSENRVLSQYIKNLMSSSSLFQNTANTKSGISKEAEEILFNDQCW